MTVPPKRTPNGALIELLAIMERLRGVDGCPWDREQTFESIAPYTIEEAYEVADAVERGDMEHLKDELGDLLFQVVFHAQMAEEAGHFDFEAVAAAIAEKLVRRHPHVVLRGAGANGGSDAAGVARIGGGVGAAAGVERLTVAKQLAVWENIKAAERSAKAAAASVVGASGTAAGSPGALAGGPSALAGVPTALPALMRAFKLSKRAARVGFDFEHADQTADKVAEELAEVREAAANAEARVRAVPQAGPLREAGASDRAVPQAGPLREAGASDRAVPQAGPLREAGVSERPPPSPEIVEEVGDLLFAVANLARKLDVDAESALRAANLKFERRFHGMERLAAARGERFETLDLAAQEALWQAVKRGE